MSILGHFRRDGDGFTGRLASLSLDATVRLAPPTRTFAKGPDYLVFVGEAEVGAAWRAADTSGALLNVKLDDPAWPEPINARLMATEDGVLPLTWIRRDPPEKPASPPPAPPE
ncbi:DUF736 domain-containing protein [Caulobacter sp. BE254]|uniref:DUF736 domain-containing protein n=1 Tax=Caulobacter sp. BE254 TaxID=2817720 RepID=UPI002854FA72|nr:DUF736 domain-containing protein [Caulobacter sp. BE254]MDR7117348.1 uncharacterized protein (DUF736 family) [Caulobacter sp. BE254]